MKKKKTTSPPEVLRVCVDRRLRTPDPHPRMMHAIRTNPENIPAKPGTKDHALIQKFMAKPDHNFTPIQRTRLLRMAMLTPNKWKPGQTITIAFLDGSTIQKTKTKKYARYWTEKTKGNANLKLRFVAGKKAKIRISFKFDTSSWSTVGTECDLAPAHEPTMNFGWLRNDTDELEWERVVVHEFGHALGCIHEHQNPAGGIKWDKPVVYKFYKGSPNFWNPEDVDSNIFDQYSKNITQFTKMDRDSIMAYFFPSSFTLDGYSMPENNKLSPMDISFIQKQYPKK